MADLKRADQLIDSFLSKANRQNEPLQYYMKTEDAKAFTQAFKAGIQRQSKWASDFIKNIDNPLYIEDNFEAMTDDQLVHLRNEMAHKMPSISEFVSQTKAFLYLKDVFEYGVVAQYKRWGLRAKKANDPTFMKADAISVTLTNENYIAALMDQADYILNRSSLDQTTLQRIINLISSGKQDGLTIDEIASNIDDEFADISYNRAFVISNTETNRAMSQGQAASMKENGVTTNSWIPAGGNTCEICNGNADDGYIPVGQAFSSGDTEPPAHPSCECYLEAGEIDLDSIDIWGGE